MTCREKHTISDMKTAIKDILPAAILAFGLAAVSGCVKGYGFEKLQENSDIGLMVKGSYAVRYDEANFQMGFNEDRKEFWVTDDNMADYFVLRCGKMPEPGGTLTADVVYTTRDDVKSRSGLEFEVQDYDSDSGKIKLWNQSYRIGVIVMILR